MKHRGMKTNLYPPVFFKGVYFNEVGLPGGNIPHRFNISAFERVIIEYPV